MTITKWTDNPILLEYSKYTPCNEIFEAVCDELGKHYSTKGFKYSRSKPKLTIENHKIKLEIGFSSSRSNIPGEWVNMEILPGFYSKQLKKNSIKGFLFGHTGIFTHKYKEDKTQIRVNQIFGDVLERRDEYSQESKIIDNNSCNIYGLDKQKFDRIVEFIDTKILPWFDKIQDKDGIIHLLNDASPTRVWSLNGKGGNTAFIEYVKLNFPDIEVEKELEKKSDRTT